MAHEDRDNDYTDRDDELSPKVASSLLKVAETLGRGADQKDEAETVEAPPLKARAIGGSKPEIFVSETTINEAARTAMRGLAEAKVPIYQRGGRLVRPAPQDLIDANERTVRTTVLVDLNATYLKMLLADHFWWQRASRDKDEKGKTTTRWRRSSSGWDVPNLILAMQGDWPFPTVTGLLSAPTLRRDGSLLDQPGLDEQTGLLLTNLPVMPEVKKAPSPEEAKEALELLLELLKEFPFIDKASRVVALSLILSMVVRGALGQVPLHLFSAPATGTGKSHLTDIASMIATGQTAPVIAAATKLEEQEKRLGAAMRSGRPLIALDNVNGVLISNLLCQGVSQRTVIYRPLGDGDDITLVCRSVFAANGNNIAIADDLDRRTLFARLDAKMERPSQRKFKQKPLEMIAADRGRYIAAALTIPLAWQAAGCPRSANTLANGFEEWMHFVRDPLVWLGEADVVSTMEVARDEDPKRQGKLALFTAMANLFGFGQGAARTTAEIIEASAKPLSDPEVEGKRRALRAAVGDDVSSAKLGAWLREAKDTRAGGMQLCSERDRSNSATWWIELRGDGA
jgi:putative DNA primase/helicase